MPAERLSIHLRKKRRIKKNKGQDQNSISVRVKLWLEIEGKPFFGEGRLQLLKGIHQ